MQFRPEYALLRTVVGLVRALPLETATALSAQAWRTLAPIINPKRHKRALDNLAIAFPDKPLPSVRRSRSRSIEARNDPKTMQGYKTELTGEATSCYGFQQQQTKLTNAS